MTNKINDKLFENINIYIDNIILDKQKKKIFGETILNEKYISNQLYKIILNEFFINGFIEKIRRIFFLKPNKTWKALIQKITKRINHKIMFDLGFNNEVKKIKIEDKIGLILECDNTPCDITSTFREYRDCILLNQYNVLKENVQNKIIIDAGTNRGEFAIYCAKIGAKKVYAFEPVSSTYDKLVNNILLNNLEEKVIPLKLGLGDKNEDMKISINPYWDEAASIVLTSDLTDAFETIKIIKLDDFLPKNEKVGFIKMDVEGYEENVFNGATNIISRDKPILAFSAYHKPTDKTILPALIKNIRPDYQIKLLKRAEEDYYCW